MSQPVSRYICIHGHFYQPPRENPWLEAIEPQKSAHPYHDWNEKIAEECYTPNAHARILDDRGRLRKLVNNYEYLSFNFGPTLLSWMESHAPKAYQAVLEADKASRKRLSGHGNALAQPYNHMIMPLASRRDKITQVRWGIEDFTRRFHRLPEGMWLPETAVDTETLEILSDHGILFTILAPKQAARFRLSGADAWISTDAEAIDSGMPYLCTLPSGRTITLFFYNAAISHAIAFEKLLDSGDKFQSRLMNAFSSEVSRPELVHVATDGESYGHHHRFGEMALAYAIEKILADPSVQLTNYGYFLDEHPPIAEAEFIENSSWSCDHDLGRWSRDCGCSLSQRADWNQKWRTSLRESMDLLRDRVDDLFARQTDGVFEDAWEVRNRYIKVILENHSNSSDFFRSEAVRHLADDDLRTLSILLEMQRNRMLMYTSCGWFFDDMTGIESLQVLKYAARVLQLARPWASDLQENFLKSLATAVSNVKPYSRGDEIFVQKILSNVADLPQVVAHVGIFCVFKNIPTEKKFFCYEISVDDLSRIEFGDRALLLGCVSVRSRLILETRKLVLAAVYFGGLDFRCSVSHFVDKTTYSSVKRDLSETFHTQSVTEVVRKLDQYFPGNYYALKDLFAEQRSQIIQAITRKMYEPQAHLFEAFYNRNKDLSKLIKTQTDQVDDTFRAAAQFVLNRSFSLELDRLTAGSFPEGLPVLMDESKEWNIRLDVQSAEKLISHRIYDLVLSLRNDPQNSTVLDQIHSLLDLQHDLGMHLNLAEAQIALLEVARSLCSNQSNNLPLSFRELAEKLAVSLDMC